ncbi:MAG: hypothetical protein RL684_1882 [Pseudomonadota bacterium]|jgi:uncharacterized protein (DUF885 family)
MSHLTSIDRRSMLALVLAAATAATLPRNAGAVAGATDAATSASAARLQHLLGDFAGQILRLAPEQCTGLGLDHGARRALKSRLADVSPAGDARWAAQLKSMLARLQAIDTAQLAPADRLRHATVRYAAEAGIAGLRFSYGGAAQGFYGGTQPYPVTQQDGAINTLPEFLDSQHQIENAADAEAYLARVAALARVLDQESAQLAERAGRGVLPPDFIAANALGILTAYRRTPIDAQGLVKSLVRRTSALGLKGDWQSRATRLLESAVYPALDRQIAAFTRSTANSPDIAGVHRLPDGEAYYQWALKLGTTTDVPADEIHALGLEQNRALKSRMDAILQAQGLTQGSVGERVQALNHDPRQLFPDNDEGRAQLIAYCNDRVAAIRTLLPKLSHLGLKSPLVVKRVPPDIQDGAALGYMNFASLDGKRPAIYYINLKSTGLWPKYQIPTLTAHEGVPGHAWQGAYLAEHSSELPLISSMMGFNAFVEGWALYAEQSVDEQGLYADDPFGQVGFLQAQQFRACRLVVDTGIHAMKWTREQAIRFLVEETGKGRDAMTSEVDRYCVSPGQACGYKMGHNEILRQREVARAALGERFDLARFNDAIVTTGGVPLSLLSGVVTEFVATSKG